MKFKLKKSIFLTALTLVLFSLLCANYSVHAVDFTKAQEFINTGKSSQNGFNNITEIGNEFAAIGSVLTYIGAGIVVGAMAYMGILYIISPPDKQAKLKQQLVGLVVSAVVIFGAYYIWKFVVLLLENTIG